MQVDIGEVWVHGHPTELRSAFSSLCNCISSTRIYLIDLLLCRLFRHGSRELINPYPANVENMVISY